MATFGYTSIKKMTPKDGNKFATDYYKQTKSERDRVVKHIDAKCAEIQSMYDKGLITADQLSQPMKQFPRTGKQPNYSVADVVSDLKDQLANGKDIPSGMLGRWNRLFEGTGDEIELELGYEPPPHNFNSLFGE